MKKFYRSSTDRFIAGVASGVAEYFEVDPIIVRLLFLALLFSGGFIVAYVIAWLFVPLSPEHIPSEDRG